MGTLRENTKYLKYNGQQVRSGGTGGVQQSPGPNKQRQRTRTSNAGQEGQSKIKNSGILALKYLTCLIKPFI